MAQATYPEVVVLRSQIADLRSERHRAGNP